MLSFDVGIDSVVVSIPFTGRDGARAVPTSISWRLLDDEGVIIKPAAALTPFTANEGQVSLAIDASFNELDDDVSYGFRRVEATLTTAAGSVIVLVDYLLDAQKPLIPGVNSFMTYETAQVQARSVGPLLGWDAAPEDERKAALCRAYEAMGSFAFDIVFTTGKACTLSLEALAESEEGFTLVKPSQLVAFRRGQLLQADFVLGGNQIEKDIADGLQSSTIGEVSQFFRPRPTMSLALCKASLAYVGKYIHWGLRIGRG